ncbi:MAG: DUF3187 family protein [Pseudomonadales bacterium]
MACSAAVTATGIWPINCSLAATPPHGTAHTAAPAANFATTLASVNRAPLVQVLGLPAASDVEMLRTQLEPGSTALWWRISLSSFNFSSQSQARDSNGTIRESILLDGELTRLALTARKKMGERAAFALTIPYIAHHSGNADQAIEQWHRLFGLPNSNRDLREQDLLVYDYQRDGQQRLRLDRNVAGIGDINLEWQQLLGKSAAGTATALRLGIKIPSGDADKFSGSGSGAAYAEFAAAGRTGTAALWRWQASGGLLLSEGGGLLGDLRRKAIVFGSAALARRIDQRWQLKAQLESHSKAYRSDTNEIGKQGLQLALGLGLQASPAMQWELFFTEDLITRSSPDFGLGISLRYLPR